jgi:hypothetical protein
MIPTTTDSTFGGPTSSTNGPASTSDAAADATPGDAAP